MLRNRGPDVSSLLLSRGARFDLNTVKGGCENVGEMTSAVRPLCWASTGWDGQMYFIFGVCARLSLTQS